MRRFPLALAVTLAAGCGGGSTAPTPVPAALSITAPASHFLYLGETYTFVMTARMSDGAVIPTGGTWASDAPAVAQVDPRSGQVRIVGAGRATISVEFRGQRASVPIRTTVRYAGTLDETVRIERCTATGGWEAQRACYANRPGGYSAALVTFTQTDNIVTAITHHGRCVGEYPSSPATATVSDTGELLVETIWRDESITVRSRWALRPVGPDRIEGTVVRRTTSTWKSGALEIASRIGPDSIEGAAEAVRPCPLD